MNSEHPTSRPTAGRVLLFLFQLPLLLLTWTIELAISRRGLSLSAIGLLAVLSMSPWLRPPLSRDLRAATLPLGVWNGTEYDPADLLATRRFRYDSVALPLLIVCAAGACVIAFRPQELQYFSGFVILLSIAGTAAVMFNHPRLISAMDAEVFQRDEIRRVMQVHEDFSLAGRTKSRIHLRNQHNGLLDVSEEPSEATHAWLYLAWSPWLVMAAMFITGASVGGTWRHRAGTVAAWLSLGLLLAGAVTWRRCLAERYWKISASLENTNDFDGAAEALDNVLAVMPNFEDTPRMWLARGRLDVRRNIDSVEALVFRALKVPNGGGRAEIEMAVTLVPESRTLRDYAASLLYDAGKTSYTEYGIASGADALWARATNYAPWRVDCTVAQAIASEHTERNMPEQVEALLAPMLPHVGDRLIRADMQSLVGDAYFEAGRLREARKHYAASMKTFSLPRFINPHAQEAMLGM